MAMRFHIAALMIACAMGCAGARRETAHPTSRPPAVAHPATTLPAVEEPATVRRPDPVVIPIQPGERRCARAADCPAGQLCQAPEEFALGRCGHQPAGRPICPAGMLAD